MVIKVMADCLKIVGMRGLVGVLEVRYRRDLGSTAGDLDSELLVNSPIDLLNISCRRVRKKWKWERVVSLLG
jgi:hypothetical protein